MAAPDLHFMRAVWRDKWLFLTAFLLLVAARLALSIIGYKRIPKFRSSIKADPSAALSMRIGWAIDFSSKAVPGATCLVQAVAGQWLLLLRGYRTEIRIGVKKGVTQKLEAHAWLVSGQTVIVGGTDDSLRDYSSLMTLG